MRTHEQGGCLALIMVGRVSGPIRAALWDGPPACRSLRRRDDSSDGFRGDRRPVFGADAVSAAAGADLDDAEGRDTMRALLVEDDKDLQRLLKQGLTDAGYVVDAAGDGEEGHF